MKNLIILKKVQTYLLYSIPFFIFLSEFALDLTVSIISIIFVYLCFFEDNRKYFNFFFKVFLLWWTYLIVLSLASSDVILSLSSSLVYVRHGIFAISVWYIFEKNENSLKIFTYTLALSFIIFILSLIIELLFFNFSFFNISSNRLSGLFLEKLVAGKYLSVVAFLTTSLILFISHNKTKYIKYIISVIIFSIILIFISGERAAFIISFIALILISILLYRSKYLFILVFLTTIVTLVIISLLNFETRNRMITYSTSQVSIDLSDLSEISYSDLFPVDYSERYKASIKMFLNKPMFGYGPKMFRKICPQLENVNKEFCSTHPHGTYFQLLAEVGLIGSIPVLIMFFYIFYCMLQQLCHIFFSKLELKYDPHEIIIMSCIFSFLFPFIPSLNFFNNWNSILLYLTIGIFLYFRSNVRKVN